MNRRWLLALDGLRYAALVAGAIFVILVVLPAVLSAAVAAPLGS